MKDIQDQDVLKPHKYPIIDGKLKSLFILPTILINKMKLKMNYIYTNSNVRNPVVSSQIHKIILDLFIEEYYPLLSRNIKNDINTLAVIMGGSAFNMNIPIKMNKNLYIPTDDIDIKIYTNNINNITNNNFKLENVLSVFKYVIVIICLYIKQIVTEIIEYSKNAFEPLEPYIKHTMKHLYNKTIKFSLSKSKFKSNKKKTKVKSKTLEKLKQIGGEYIKKNLIKLKQRRFGILKSFKLKIQFKNENEKTKIITDITDLTYNDTYNLLMSKINDPDVLITTKISYSIKHINLIVPYNDKSRPSITFSDTKIIYPNIHNPYFFSYYFMNNNKYINENISLEQLLKQNIYISNIIDTKSCKNNCRYISIKYLQIDIIYMLRFAELLENEDISNGVIIVPVGSIYKYYKYMIKFIRTYIIKKFFNGTLVNNKNFIDSSRKLMRYIENNLDKETKTENETLPINIICKNIISNFHQDFFIKQTMFPEYEVLKDIVNDYNNTVKFINKSCSLFKNLDETQNNSGKTIDSISILYADNKVNENINNMNGGNIKRKNNKKNKIILHDNYSFEDFELDSNKEKTKTHKSTLIENKIIINKLHKLLKNEIQFLSKLSHTFTT